MQAYDMFLNNKQPEFTSKLLINNANRLLQFIKNKYFLKQQKVSVLEIGPGKGYFYQAFCQGNYGDYYAMDRNQNILEHLHIDDSHLILGTLPYLNTKIKFDIIFAGFVIEHLENGLQLYDTLRVFKEHLNDNGIIILQFPDCMKLGMEFYNIDYTHTFPTTKRNINQASINYIIRMLKNYQIKMHSL